VEAIEKSRSQSIEVLTEFLRIPSISTDRARRDDVRRAADFLADRFRALGMTTVEVMPTAGHPIVHAEWLGAPDAPTVLIYGHYDVQPIANASLWTSPPFEPVVRDGKIWARGATDDKGQLLTHALAAGAHLAETGRLPVNVKFLIEGEEEIGSEHLGDFVRQHRERLSCDAIVVSDTAMYAPNIPSICTGLRGIAYTEFTLRGARQDLHSGSFGGVVDNPAIALARLIAGLKDPVSGKILIDGFYDGVEQPSAAELDGWAKLPASEDRVLEMTGSPRLYGEAGRTIHERTWSRPTLDVNGIWGGFIEEGSMTVLPARASAKVSMRLVKNQSSADITEKLRRHIERALPDTVVLERFDGLHGGEPWTCSLEHPAVQAAFAAVEKGFGRTPVPTREGGSIPIVPMLAETLQAPAVLMGFGLHDEGAHSHDEHFDLDNFQAGIRSAAHYFTELRDTAATSKRTT
jgi:acetylornithine deacetylase/succinyl-diaminopimelate desuccinylase-like protein